MDSEASKEIKKSCLNCQDSIVCYGMDEPEDKVCDDWQMDFMLFQELLEGHEQ